MHIDFLSLHFEEQNYYARLSKYHGGRLTTINTFFIFDVIWINVDFLKETMRELRK